jgi:hypothetical protein
VSAELAELEAMLERLRALRNAHRWGEVRQAYNAAIDRLDVLCSRVYEGEKQPAIRLRGFWSRVWNR